MRQAMAANTREYVPDPPEILQDRYLPLPLGGELPVKFLQFQYFVN